MVGHAEAIPIVKHQAKLEKEPGDLNQQSNKAAMPQDDRDPNCFQHVTYILFLVTWLLLGLI